MTVGTGYHEGERAVQERAGVTAAAARLEGMLDAAPLHRGLIRFLADQTFAALTARDAAGRLWISPLVGGPGFVHGVGSTTLAVNARPVPGDPLADPAAGQPVGLLVIDFAARRRIRVNGTLAAADGGGLRIEVEVEQAYGNCPQHITPRVVVPAVASAAGGLPRSARALDPRAADVVRRADTVLVGTAHPTRGADASHRGGAAGFVRVDDDTHLSWPDHAGNAMFNTLGNLAVDPTAALLVPDFENRCMVQLSGSAAVEWDVRATDGTRADGTGRRVRFTVEQVVTR